MDEVRIVLQLEDFRKLVRGQVVEVRLENGQLSIGQVKIALSDLGWDVMARELADAESEMR